jgi:hypothetical protein
MEAGEVPPCLPMLYVSGRSRCQKITNFVILNTIPLQGNFGNCGATCLLAF